MKYLVKLKFLPLASPPILAFLVGGPSTKGSELAITVSFVYYISQKVLFL